MDSNRETLKASAAEWSEEAAHMLAPSVPFGSVEDLAGQVQSGAAVLFKVERGGAVVAFYILRIDQLPSGNEGVLVAAGGRDDFDLTANMLPHIERQFSGCRWIRIHTARPGLVRKLTTKHGYGAAEMVMRKVLK